MTTGSDFFDEPALVDRLVAAVSSRKRPLTFLVGSPLTAPVGDGARGVPGVEGMIEEVARELGKPLTLSDLGGEDRYQGAFRVLLSSRGTDAVNRVVRRAVLQASVGAPPDLVEPALDGTLSDQRRACAALEQDLLGWSLSPGVEYLGRLAASFPRSIGHAVLTSNFDPLIEISIQRAGGACWRTAPQGDGNLLQTRGRGCHVVHVHGYWYDADTLHLPTQLKAERPQLRASLRRLFGDTTLVVVAYGGWDDVFSRALIDVVTDGGAFPEVIWTFHETDTSKILHRHARLLERLQPGLERGGRVTLYRGVDCHALFPRLWAILPAGAELDDWEISRRMREGVTGDLHRIATDLSRHSGEELGQELIAAVEAFGVRYLRDAFRVAVVARQQPSGTFLRTCTPALGTSLLSRLTEVSDGWGDKMKLWAAAERLGPGDEPPLDAAGVAVPLVSPGGTLGGHLFFLRDVPFTPSEIALLLELGRTIASVLRVERERLAVKADLGRLRHEILGPVQGLVSAAKLLSTRAGEAGLAGDHLEELLRRVDQEAERIRIAVANQRAASTAELGLRRRREDLIRLVRRVASRALRAYGWRRGSIQVEQSPPSVLALDVEAFELAVFNLMRLAQQLSLSDRDLHVRCWRVAGAAVLRLEYVGWPMPESMAAELVGKGTGTAARSAAAGDLLALANTNAIVAAHGGTVAYELEPLEGPWERVQPFRGRFTVSLPEPEREHS